MDKDELSDLTLAQLRALAKERGLRGVDRLRREQLIDRLAAAPAAPAGRSGKAAKAAKDKEAKEPKEGKDPEAGKSAKTRTLLRRAREVVREAVEKRKGRATRGTAKEASETPAPTQAPRTSRPKGERAAAEPETETMARLYEEQGHFDRAIEIYRVLLATQPAKPEWSARIEVLRARQLEAARAVDAGAPPGPSPQPMPRTEHLPFEPSGMLDYEELPDHYGVDEIVLMPQSPWHIFAYWEATPEGRAAARSHLGGEGHAARLVIRLHTLSTAGGPAQEFVDIELDLEHGRRYLDAPRPGARVRAALGLRAPSGAFAPIAHSALVVVPNSDPGPEGPVEWMEVLPASKRGAEFEPLVIATRGRERLVRGLPGGWEGSAWRHPGSRVPLPPGLGPHEQREAPSSPWLRLPGSSNVAPPPQKRGGK